MAISKTAHRSGEAFFEESTVRFSSRQRVDAYIRETTEHNGITRTQPHDVKSCDTLSRHAQQG